VVVDYLKDQRDEHQQLRSIIGEQYRHADPGPVESFALIAVHELLGEHQPQPDEAHSSGVMCLTCWDTWPCGVYRVIKNASRRGE
jgi:hypothetical protein